MFWSLYSQEEIQNSQESFLLPLSKQKTHLAFVLKKDKKTYTLTSFPKVDEFPIAFITWEEFQKVEIWKEILYFYPLGKIQLAYYWSKQLKEKAFPADCFLELFGLALHYQNFSDWEELGKLGEASHLLCDLYPFPIRVLRLWDRFSSSEHDFWLKLWKELEFGKNRIQEVIQYYYELRGEKRKEVLKEIREKIKKDITQSQKNNLVLEILKDARFPLSRTYQKKFYQQSKKLQKYLPKNLAFDYPRDLEIEFLDIRLRFQNIEELQEQSQGLQKKEVLEIIKETLEML